MRPKQRGIGARQCANQVRRPMSCLLSSSSPVISAVSAPAVCFRATLMQTFHAPEQGLYGVGGQRGTEAARAELQSYGFVGRRETREAGFLSFAGGSSRTGGEVRARAAPAAPAAPLALSTQQYDGVGGDAVLPQPVARLLSFVDRLSHSPPPAIRPNMAPLRGSQRLWPPGPLATERRFCWPYVEDSKSGCRVTTPLHASAAAHIGWRHPCAWRSKWQQVPQETSLRAVKWNRSCGGASKLSEPRQSVYMTVWRCSDMSPALYHAVYVKGHDLRSSSIGSAG
jgi:hypothetical protein